MLTTTQINAKNNALLQSKAETKSSVMIELEKLREEIQKKSMDLNKAVVPTTGVLVKSSEEEYIDELEDFTRHPNSLPNPNIDYIWVLSARHTYLRRPVDVAISLQDPVDDRNRMQLGIQMAKGITAIRARKTVSTLSKEDYLNHGPIIIYNGSTKHNFDLGIASLGDNAVDGYPFEKFIILPLDLDKIHTGGQFLSVKKINLTLSNDRAFALVTHAYHFPRVSRMIDHPAQKCIDGRRCFAFLADRELQAPGAMADVRGEVLSRSSNYIKTGFIAKEPAKRIVHKVEDHSTMGLAMDDLSMLTENKAKSELLFLYSQRNSSKTQPKVVSDPAMRAIEIIREYLLGEESVETTAVQKNKRRRSIAS